VGAFTLSGMDTAVAQSIARGFDKSLIKGFWLKLRWSLPASILTLFIGGYYIYKQDEILGVSLIIIGLFSPLLYASTLYTAYFNGKKEFKKIAYDNALKNIFISICILIIAYTTKSVIYSILAFFVSNTAVSVVRYTRLARKISQNNSRLVDKFSFSLGKHLSLMESFSLVSTYIDKILIFQLLGATQLAIYTIALAPVKQAQGISKLIRTLLLPKFSTRTLSEIRSTLAHKVRISIIICACLALGYVIFAEILFTYIFPQYREAIRYSQVLSILLLFMPSMFYIQALTTLGKKKELYILNITKPIIRIIPLVLLVPKYGVWGAVFSFLIFYVVHYAMLFILFQNIARQHDKLSTP
jgi:O-antigen/teichoic acid export membrane protein